MRARSSCTRPAIILGAIDTYKAALAIAPDRADALSNLGAAYVRLGQYDDAIEQYQAAIKADPANTHIRLNLALAYYKSARPNLAIPELKRVVASEPEASNAYLVLADCYLQTGQDQELVALLKPRAQMFGNDLAYAYLLGTALLHTERAHRRAEVRERGVRGRRVGRGAPAHGNGVSRPAGLSRREGRARAARSSSIRGCRRRTRCTAASLLALGEPDAAERAFRRELDLNVNDFEANLQMGHIRRNAQRLDDASIYLERANTIRPGDLTARKLLASLRLQTGKTDEAVVMLEAHRQGRSRADRGARPAGDRVRPAEAHR